MRRDPTEFRQRFAAWKDGENYWDTRGEDMLPGYSGGKTGFYNTHRDKWRQFLISKGVGAEQADRLSVYFAAQDSLESGGGTSSAARQKNNFGGMQRGGKNISYDTVQDYMNDKWNMMNKRFSRALNAKTVQEYATLINDPKYAGKGYLYAVADGYNQKNPQDRAWVARQIQHMNNYTKAMMGIAGQKGFVARPVPKAPVVSKAEPIQKTNPIPSAVELLKQNELPVVLPEPTVTTTQTPTQAAQQAQLSEYIQKPLVSEKVPVLGGDYWENFFNNNSLDQFQSLIQQQMTSHKHGKNILPRHTDGKTPGEYNEELVELPEVRVDDEGNVVNNGRRGSVRLPEVVVKPDHNVREAVDRYYDKLSRRSEKAWYTNPITGESYMPKGGPLESVYPEFDLIGLGAFAPSLRRGIIKSIQGVKQKNIAKTFNELSNEQVDKLYFDALDKNDMTTAQLLRDLHFKKASAGNKAVDVYGNPQKTYHTVGDAYNPNFTKFNPDIEGTHSAIYTTNDPFMSGSYSSKLLSEEERNYIIENIRQRELQKYTDPRNLNRFSDKLREKYTKIYNNDIIARRQILKDHPKLAGNIDENRLKRLYVNLQNPVVLDNGGGFWNHIDLSQLPDDVYKNIRVDLRAGYLSNNYSTRSLEDAINKAGNYDGAIVNNVIDYGPNKAVWGASFKPANVYSVQDPKKLKLFDAVTYDNNGNIIPLSKRDNFNIDDIRYGIVPFLGIGGAAYGLSEYKHGKSPIHINPANRGKFNALKKRTGKTTEQLTHSKNPLTRKRAVFALNSRKWRRK